MTTTASPPAHTWIRIPGPDGSLYWQEVRISDLSEIAPGKWILEAWFHGGEVPRFRRVALTTIKGFSDVDPHTLCTIQRGEHTLRIYPDGTEEVVDG